MKLGTHHYWLALLLAGAVVCALALFLRTHSASADSATAQSGLPQTIQSPAVPVETFEGILTDSRCGAKHSAKVGLSAADCTRVCVHAGEHFALVDGENTYILNGEPARLKRMAGERVRIAGNLNGNTIEVVSVAEANPKSE
jgi:hypothetical protein